MQTKARGGRLDLPTVMKELGKREILSVLLEAGPRLNGGALTAGVVHKLVLFYAPKLAGHSKVPLLRLSNATLPALHVRSCRQFGADIAIELLVKNAR